MKIQNKNSIQKKKYTILALTTIIVLGGICAAYFIIFQKTSPINTPKVAGDAQSTTTQSSDSTSSQGTADDSAKQKQQFLDSETKNQQTTSTPPQQTGEKDNQSIDLSAKTNGDTVVVTTKLASIPSGSCTLTVTGSSGSITQQAEVIYTPEYSTCAGFTVQKKSVNSQNWTIKLTVTTKENKIEKSISFTP